MNRNKRLKIYSALLALVLTTQLAGCNNKSKNDSNYESSYDSLASLNNLEYFKKYISENGIYNTYYKGENIIYAFDKETKEAKYYIYNYGITNYKENYLEGVIKDNNAYELYDIETGKLIYYNDIDNVDLQIGYNNYQNIIDNNIVIELKNIDKYTNDIEIKEWYTIEEIKELEPKIIESINNVKKLIKE